MYSRYTPNAHGGYDRRPMPDAWEQEAEQGSGKREEGTKATPIHPGGHDPPRPARPGPFMPDSPPWPRQIPPGQPPVFPIPGLFGPEGLLNRVLPRAADAEELLILAILLLSLKQDGASGMELMVAAALYLLL